MTSLIVHPQSPFDAIREIDEDGSEFWRARRLQPLMGYPRWNDFQRVLDRAMAAARNTGSDVQEVFRESPENPSDKGGRPRSDFKLTRFAAYLTAMNGDPNKREVAAAQAYFAAKTREAETRSTQQPMTVNWDQAAAIARCQYGLDVSTSDFRDLLNKGGILTNSGKPHKKWEHLFWPLPTRWEVHASVLPQLIAFAAKVRRELAAAEEDLQMSLPLPISALTLQSPPRPGLVGGGSW